MNRIILIGNGFDLAHGMKTSYKDFLKDFWEKTIKEIHNIAGHDKFENDEIVVRPIPSKWLPGYSYSNLVQTLKNNNNKIQFKNSFLKKISEKNNLASWVDIENEYYSSLKQILKRKPPIFDHGLQSKYDIKRLNDEFDRIKGLLRTYLVQIEKNHNLNNNTENIINQIGYKVYKPTDPRDLSEEAIDNISRIEFDFLIKKINKFKSGHFNDPVKGKFAENIVKELGYEFSLSEIKSLLYKENAKTFFDLASEETLLLNFNYTKLETHYKNTDNFDFYIDKLSTRSTAIHIHGTIEKYDNNPMIFGFGDELDDSYSEIENLVDNRYLENIKSIKYLESAGYKKLLRFINTDFFQVFIMGHSCGISDRTLLNTLFEHDNCASIKPFYHQIEEGVDNYSDIIKNISRNFNDKTKMRDRVVNKTYCESLL